MNLLCLELLWQSNDLDSMPNVGDMDLIPGWGTRMLQNAAKNSRKKELQCNMFKYVITKVWRQLLSGNF